MRSPTEHLKQQGAARPICPVGPLRLADPAPGLTPCRLVDSDTPVRIHRAYTRSIQSRSRCLSTPEGIHGLAAATP